MTAPTSRRPTIEDVAAASGVSVATVSRALRGLPNVAEATRQRVLSAATELQYEVDPQASRLATGKTTTIGLVAPLFGTWYANGVVMGAESVFGEAGYDLLVAPVRDRVTLASFLARARSFGRRVDGVLLIDLYLGGDELARLADVGVPTASVGEDLGDFRSVTIDNPGAAADATRHLVGLGHTDLGLVGGTQSPAFHSPVPDRREQGWRDALSEAGLDAGAGCVVDGGFHVEGGAAAMARLMELDRPPTGVVCMSDRMAVGALTEARRRGLDVPGDVSIVGFDDDDLAGAFGLTTMRQPVTSLGAMAASILLGALGHAGAILPVVPPVELVVRATTGPPPPG